MLNSVTSAKGIDARVYALQKDLFNELLTTWDITSAQYESYALVERNYKTGATRNGYIPEIKLNGKEYKEVLHNDKYPVSSFFGLNDNSIINNGVNHETANIHIVFFCDLSVIESTEVRASIDVRRDVRNILNRRQYGFELEKEIIGLDSVLREYSGVDYKKMAAVADNGKNHCFRFDLKCTYDPNTRVNSLL